MANTDPAETPLDELFNALDGYTLNLADRSWRLQVYSVRELGNWVWIQLDVVGTPTYVLTLRQSVSADANTVLATLSRYLRLAKDAPDAVVFDRIISGTLMAVPSRVGPEIVAD